MPVNADKTGRWKEDIAASVDFYNSWFLEFAPQAFRDTRQKTTREVQAALETTACMRDVSPLILRRNPGVLPILRMATAPPLAADRLIGLAGVATHLVRKMERSGEIPPRMKMRDVQKGLEAIGRIIKRLADKDILVWLEGDNEPTEEQLYRASTVVADRLCGAVVNPIIRNAQEKRQLASIRRWLEKRRYRFIETGVGTQVQDMEPGTFCFHLNVPVTQQSGRKVNIPVDAAIMPDRSRRGAMPLLVEAKSAGDFTNTNKRRKEEATKMAQLRASYGHHVRFILFLCGYFDSGYLGYEAAEGIDWVWEHRIDDLAGFGL